MDEDEVCMTMSSEIEEIVYTDEVTCTHKEFKSCHSTFKSVLRKSMVKQFREIKQNRFTVLNYLYICCRLRSVRQITSKNATLIMKSGPSPSKWKSAKNPGKETVMFREI